MYVEYNSNAEYKEAYLYIMDIYGKSIQEIPVVVSSGNNTIAYDASELSSSTYLVYIQAGGHRSTVKKFVKL